MTYDFESLSCPMCGGELIYSEGTHDLCCAKNTYELSSMEMGRGRSVEASGDGGWGQQANVVCEREQDKINRTAMPGDKSEDRGEFSTAMPGDESEDRGERLSAMPGDKLGDSGRAFHEPRAGYGRVDGNDETPGEVSTPQASDRVVKKSSECVFALSFTESGKYGTLWSIRTVHGGTNYFSLMRLMDKIEKRQRRGEPLAANVPNLPRKVERSKECKLAFRYSIEVEDLYSIKYSSETVDRLAMYYGLTEPDIRHIQAIEIGEEKGA